MLYRYIRWTLAILMLLMGLVSAASAAEPEVMLAEDFNDAAKTTAHLKIDSAQWRVDNGTLKTVPDNDKVVSLQLLPDIADCTIEFDARITKAHSQGHFGIDVHSFMTQGKSSFEKLYCWSTGALGFWEMSGNQTVRNVGIGAVSNTPIVGETAKWMHFRFVCYGKLIYVYADNQFVTAVDNVAADKGAISLYSCELDIEVDNMKIKPVSMMPSPTMSVQSPDGMSRPLIRESFDTMNPKECCEGVKNKALSLSHLQNGSMTVDAVGMFSNNNATVMFWMKPEFDYWKPQGHKLGDFLSVVDAQGKPILRLSMNDWSIRGEVKDRFNENLFYVENRAVDLFRKDEWHHVALVVSADGLTRLYIDGMLYTPTELGMATSLDGSGSPAQRNSIKQNAVDLSGVSKLIIGAMDNGARECSVDELMLQSRALSDAEVAAAYRQAVPVDAIIERKIIPANKPEHLLVEVHPAGELPCSPGKAAAGVSGYINLQLTRENGSSVIAQTKRPISVGKQYASVDLPTGKLNKGRYTLTCSVQLGKVRYTCRYTILAYNTAVSVTGKQPQQQRVLSDIKVTADMAGLLNSGGVTTRVMADGSRYVEAGSHNMDRIALPISIPAACRNGRPMMLEISWPDDKPRSMGLYLYPKSDWANDRDRLEGGILAGGIYPNTGHMQTARYVIYPWMESYLLEVRTMAAGLPAAISAVRLTTLSYPLAKTQAAGGDGHRMIGHVDEDQSFDYLTGSFRDLPLGEGLTDLVAATRNLIDYFDDTNQDIIAYPVLRYSGAQYALPGSTLSRYSLLGGYSMPSLMMDMLAERGKKYLAIINLQNLPELCGPSNRFKEYQSRGYFVVDRYGKTLNQPNPVHPAVREMMIKHISEVLRRFAKHPAFVGLDIWRTPIWYDSLDQGYDDYTVSLFEKETGIRVPKGSADEDRYAARYTFLTGAKRQQWLAWRSRKITSFYTKLASMLKQANAGSMCDLSLVQPEEKMQTLSECESLNVIDYYYQQLGIDLKALNGISNMAVTPLRRCQFTDWKKHWDGSFTLDDEFLFSDKYGELFRQRNKPGLTSSYNIYWESFNGSLDNNTYKSMFQNADVKPNGRHYLRELAFNLASSDASIMLSGGQPIGSAGRDVEMREFAAAFRTLPAKPFREVPGKSDPVCVRYLETKEGVYLYAVNRIWTNATAKVKFGSKLGKVVMLSPKQLLNVNGGELSISLAPYQLKTYRLGKGVLPVSYITEVADDVKQWYREKRDDAANRSKALTDRGVSVPEIQNRMKAISLDIESGRYADAHRLLFSKLISVDLPKMEVSASNGYLTLQNKMLSRSQYAINCGSGEYYTAKNGTLFWPDDRAYSAGGYGFIDRASKVTRDVSALTAVDDAKLYETEAYDMKGYRFTVKPGRYTVRLYMRIGYPPSQQTGKVILSYSIDGQKLMSDADLYTLCGQSPANAVMKEFKGINVKGDVLEILCQQKEGIDSSGRLINAIEVIPE